MSRTEQQYHQQKLMSLAGIDFDSMSQQQIIAQWRHFLEARIHGVCFSPYINDQGPGAHLDPAQIRSRLNIIEANVRWVRTFSCTQGNEQIPLLARDLGLQTLVGVWLDDDLANNEAEIANAIAVGLAGQADIIAVGNEVLLRDELSESQLLEYINRVKQALPNIDVGYVDAYYKFVDYPAVTAACDVILANCYPFWEGCAAQYSLLYMKDMYRRVTAVANGKKVIISETGWPNVGSAYGNAMPSTVNAVRYFLNTYQWAEEEGIDIFYFSAFDERWKVADEGDVGAYWGLWDSDGQLKYGAIDYA